LACGECARCHRHRARRRPAPRSAGDRAPAARRDRRRIGGRLRGGGGRDDPDPPFRSYVGKGFGEALQAMTSLSDEAFEEQVLGALMGLPA